MKQSQVIDYVSTSTPPRRLRVGLLAGHWIKRHWILMVALLGAWIALGHWEARVQARRHAAMLIWSETLVWEEPYTSGLPVILASSFTNDYVQDYRAKIVRARIGNITWTPSMEGELTGAHMPVRGSCTPSRSRTYIPMAYLPPSVINGGTIQVTYTLEVTASPNPLHTLLYIGPVTVTVDRTVAVTIPPTKSPGALGITVPANSATN